MPPTKPVTIAVPFTGGPDESVADEYIDPSTRLLFAVNGRWLKDGALDKRRGVAAVGMTPLPGFPSDGIPADPAIGVGRRLITRLGGQELDVIDGDKLYSIAPDGVGVIGYRSLVSPCVATREHLFTNAAGFASVNVSEGSGFRAVVCRTWTPGSVSGDIVFSLYSLSTGAPVIVQAQLTHGSSFRNPIAIIQGSYCYVFYSTTSGQLIGTFINLMSFQWDLTPTVIASDLVVGLGLAGAYGDAAFDATPYVGGATPGVLIIYAQSKGGGISVPTYLRLESLPSFSIAGAVTLQANLGQVFLVAARHDANLGVVWFSWVLYTNTNSGAGGGLPNPYGGQGGANPGNTIWAACLSPGAWTTTAAAFALGAYADIGYGAVAIEPFTSTTAYVQTAIATATPANAAASLMVTTAGSVQANSLQWWPFGTAASRPFRVTCGGTSRIYALFALVQQIATFGNYFCGYLLLDVQAASPGTAARMVASIAPRQGNYTFSIVNMLTDGRLPGVTSVGTPNAGTFRFPVVVNASEEFVNQQGVVQTLSFLDLATADFTGEVGWESCEGAAEAFLSGGAPSFYDGVGVQELSFPHWPLPSPSSPTITTSGSSLSTGTYGYAFVFAQVDAAGQIHRSCAYQQTVALAGPNYTVAWALSTLCYSSRYVANNPPVVEVYRTQANLTTLYYLGSVTCSNAASAIAQQFPLAFTDTTSDSTIVSNALLYTTGGVLDAPNPPSFRALIRHVDRLWGIDDTGYVIWYSTNFNASDAPYFNEGLTLQFTDGPLTALSELDGNLVVFSGKRIWIVAGDGPPATGQGSDLTTATPIPTPEGAADWRSVVTFPEGLFFQGPSGRLYMMDRGLNVTTKIGRQVQDIVNDTVQIISATLAPAEDVVRFVLSSGTVLTWDYVVQRWALATYPASVNAAAVWAGAWSFVGADGRLYQEKSDAAAAPWMDTPSSGASSFVPTTVTLAWVKPGGLQGWAELGPVQGLARMLDPANVVLSAAYDYGGASESRTYAYSALAAQNPTMALWQFQAAAANAQPTSVQITLADAPPLGGIAVTGRGMRWLGLTFEFTPLGGRNMKLGAGVKQ